MLVPIESAYVTSY